MKDAHKKLMLVKLSIKQWSGRKFDKRATQKILDEYGAKDETVRANKLLVAKDELKKTQKASNAARTWHYEHTLPWKDDGWRILTNAMVTTYNDGMRGHHIEVENAWNYFLTNYTGFINDAITDLNGLFNSSDYPTTAELESKFHWSIDMQPLPVEDDVRIDVNQQTLDEIKEQIRATTTTALADAAKDAWNRLHEVISNLHKRLSDTDAVFRNSLVSNICELVSILPKLNFTDDPELERIYRTAEKRFCNMDSPVICDNLRENKAYRLEKAAQAKDLLNDMAAFMGA